MNDLHTFGLRVISINGVFYDGRAKCIILPCIDGERAIQANHEEMWVAVYAGIIKIQKPDDTWIECVCGYGSIQVANNRCTVISDTIEKPEDIDLKRAQEALEIAKEKVRQKNSIAEYRMSQAAMARALSRLKAGSKINLH